MIIESGTGNGYTVGVTNENQLQVRSETHSLQHYQSAVNEQAYQVIGDFASVNNSTHTILHMKNTNSTLDMYISYIRFQCLDMAGGTALPSALSYFAMGFGRTYASGGTAVTPVNMNTGSGKVSAVTCYDNNATMAGTFTEFERWYVLGEAQEQKYNKEGSIVIKPGDTFEIRFVSDHTSGVAQARVTFLMGAN